MEPDFAKRARERIKNRFGAAVAAKATAEFCMAFGLLGASRFAVAGQVGGGVLEDIVVGEPEEGIAGPRAVVMEFESSAREEVPSTGKKKAGFARAVKKGAVELESVAEQPKGGSHESRGLQIRDVRDAFYKKAADVRVEIERSSRGFHRPGPETLASPQMPSVVAEICWLNESLRTWTDPRSLAEVAADPKVTRLDLPRRLEPDLFRVAEGAGIPDYRNRSGRTGKGVIVAVIDSEVAKRHPAFQDRVIPKHNYSRELWGNPDGHGTAVSGIIGARSGEFEGIAPEVTLYNYKVLATNKFMGGDDFDGSLAIQQALEDGAQIANCSWGAGDASDGTSREARACNAAWELGMVIVKSAGNRGPQAKTLTTPADAEGVIVVGATDLKSSAVSDYSSRGPTADGRHRPHILGVGGTSTEGATSCLVGGGYGGCGYGTSFAAPYVTGIVALLVESQPGSTPEQIRNALTALGNKLSGFAVDAQGSGVISAKGLP